MRLFTLIKNVSIFQPADIGVKDILICNDKIIDIGDNLPFSYPGLNTIDGQGLSAIPGYIDQHVHVTGGGGEGSFKTRVPELVLSQCIRAGVTTVLGLLGTDGITRNIENLVAKTKALNEEGITAYCLTGNYAYPTRTLTGDIKTDVAYIQEIIGVKIAISDHRSSHITKEELTRLVSDVRVTSLISGKPGLVVFHLGRGKSELDLINEILDETDLPIKHFRPTHVGKIQAAAIAFAKRGGYIDFTTGRDTSKTATYIMNALTAGAPQHLITISTDANGSQPRWDENNEMVGLTAASMDTMHQLIKALVFEQELPISSALEFATSNVAKALGLELRKGTLAPGFDADIVLLDQQLNIDTVFARGQLMLRGGELKTRGTFEQ